MARHHRFIVFLNNEILETIVEAHSCGDTALQREVVFAVDGNEWQAADGLQGGLRHSCVGKKCKGFFEE